MYLGHSNISARTHSKIVVVSRGWLEGTLHTTVSITKSVNQFSSHRNRMELTLEDTSIPKQHYHYAYNKPLPAHKQCWYS